MLTKCEVAQRSLHIFGVLIHVMVHQLKQRMALY